MQFMDGAEYEGEWRRGTMHGYGWFIGQDRYQYKGEWEDGKRVGWGWSVNFGEEKEEYEGNFVNGQRHGTGTTRNSKGEVTYRGEWRDHQRHGRGTEFWTETFCSPDVRGVAPRYIGDFVDGLFHGNGELKRPDGMIQYAGSFAAGELHGHGEYFLADGARYRGEFANNDIHGEGVYYFRDGRHYHGTFENHCLIGHGCLIYPDFRYAIGVYRRYKVLFIADRDANSDPEALEVAEEIGIRLRKVRPEGSGTIVWGDGSIYDGHFVNGVPEDAHGLRVSAGGGAQLGAFHDGRCALRIVHGISWRLVLNRPNQSVWEVLSQRKKLLTAFDACWAWLSGQEDGSLSGPLLDKMPSKRHQVVLIMKMIMQRPNLLPRKVATRTLVRKKGPGTWPMKVQNVYDALVRTYVQEEKQRENEAKEERMRQHQVRRQRRERRRRNRGQDRD